MSQDSLIRKGGISIQGNVTNINDNKQTIINSSVSYDVRMGHKDLLSYITYTNVIKNDVKLSDDIVFRVQPRWINENSSFFNYEQVSRLYSRKIDYRFESALGGGFFLLKKDLIKVTFSYGVIYSNTKYVDDTFIETFRHSPRLQIFGNFKKVSLFVEGLYQPSFKSVDNYNYNWIIKLMTPLTNKLYFSINSIRTFESYVYTGTAQLNNNLTFGVEYKF